MKLRAPLFASLALVCLAPASIVMAQTTERGVGVADQERPDYDPIGIRAGSFIMYPSVTGSVSYTDNQFAQPNNEQDDTIFVIAPEIRVESQWNRHSLNLRGGLSSSFHDQNDGDDATDYGVGAEGRLDITRATSLSLSGAYDVTHEDRGSPDQPAAAVEPTEVTEVTAEAALDHRFNRLTLRPAIAFTDTDFEDVALVGGGVVNNDDRDRQELVGSLRAGYEVSPALEVFAEGRYRTIDYDGFDDNLGGGGVARRDSDGYDALVGASFDVGRLARGEVAVGYTEQDYESSLIPSVDGFIYEAGIEWFVTELTTVNLSGTRQTEETTLAGASGNLSTSVDLRVDHELLRNLLIGVEGGYTRDVFEGIGREDDNYSAGVDVTYLINRNLRAQIGYDFETRETNAIGSEFDENIVFLLLRAAL